ncbi:MAG: cytochrome C biogenesis protein, partial [Dehalococcoidia bacterium]|nr:cytochrome C biogenesis protein [Dehalococcoidia bacterium]
MSNSFSQIWVLVWKDLLLEMRTKDLFIGMSLFALVTLVVFNFAFDLRREQAVDAAPGVLWVAVIFAGVLGIGRTISAERDMGTLEGLLLAPVDRGNIYIGKLVANLIFMGVVETLVFILFGALFNLPILQPGILPVAFLGTFGFAAVGTLLAGVSANSRARELLLPILLLPIVVPVMIAAVEATANVLSPRELS